MSKKKLSVNNINFFNYSANLSNLIDPLRHFKKDFDKPLDLQMARALISLSLPKSAAQLYSAICSLIHPDTGLLMTTFNILGQWIHMRRQSIPKVLEKLFEQELVLAQYRSFKVRDVNYPSVIIFQLLPVPLKVYEKVSKLKDQVDGDFYEILGAFRTAIPYELAYRQVEEIEKRIRLSLRSYTKEEIILAIKDRQSFFKERGKLLFGFGPVEDTLPHIRNQLQSEKRKSERKTIELLENKLQSLNDKLSSSREEEIYPYLRIILELLPEKEKAKYQMDSLPYGKSDFLKDVHILEALKKDIQENKLLSGKKSGGEGSLKLQTDEESVS